MLENQRAACALMLWGITGAIASAQGVPSLSNTPQDYVQYAETDLPNWYQTPGVANTDNTPADNPITNAGAELGRVLFYDPRLSHNDGTACSSCHIQENGFSDPDQFSEGFEGGLTGRHSMGLTNARYYQSGRFFWDERAATLEDQVLMPIRDAVEMGSNLADLTAELASTDYYPVLFERAFGDSQVTSDRMAKAMAQFVRAMSSYQSPFDEAILAGNAMNPDFSNVNSIPDPAAAADGHAIFDANCASCHRGATQSAPDTFNIGLDAVDEDEGAGDGEFKVPSLRNIAVREGYMHDGRFATLEEVIEFYSSGVQNNPNLSRGLTPGGFGFSEDEKSDLIAFLNTLTDEAFLTSELFSDPFITLAGDYDGDGVVDADDYAEWTAAFGMTIDDVSGPLKADGNGNGIVDAADYVVWRDNLGAAWDDGLTLLAVAVPEPSTIILAVLAAIGVRRLRSTRRSPS